MKVNELVDLTTSGIVSRYTGYEPNNLWSSLQCLGTHECVGEPSVNLAVSNMKGPDLSDSPLWNMSGAHGIRVTAEIELPHHDSDLGLGAVPKVKGPEAVSDTTVSNTSRAQETMEPLRASHRFAIVVVDLKLHKVADIFREYDEAVRHKVVATFGQTVPSKSSFIHSLS